MLCVGDNLFIDSEDIKDDYALIPAKPRIQPLYFLNPILRWNDKGSGDIVKIEETLTNLIKDNKNKIIIICCGSKSAEQRINNIIENQEYTTNKISFLKEAKNLPLYSIFFLIIF